jgi:hypothetical protein
MNFTEKDISEIINKSTELEERVKKLENLEDRIKMLEEKVSILVDTKVNSLLQSSSIKTLNSETTISIIFTRYKKSILVKNKFTDKNTTIHCKDLLKELGAKWFKNADGLQGWLFVSAFNESKNLETNCKFIIDKFNNTTFNLEYEYNNE